MEAIYHKELKRHREKIGELVVQIRCFKKSRNYSQRGRELVLRVKTELEAQGHKVSLRKLAEWLGVPWSTVHYKPRKRKPAAVDREIEQAIYQQRDRLPGACAQK